MVILSGSRCRGSRASSRERFMTSIFYPDIRATSPNGKYTVEVRSPHNGTIKHKDGSVSSDREFATKYREHQKEFRYRLIDNQRTPLPSEQTEGLSGSVLWVRWQREQEDSPHEVLVSDDGWSILRTHGFNPELIAVSPQGKDAVLIEVESSHEEDLVESSEDEDREEISTRSRRHRWRVATWHFSTAGNFWSQHSWPYFLQFGEGSYFVWRTCNGQRFVINLTTEIPISDEERSDSALTLAMNEAEAEAACRTLSELSTQVDQILVLLNRRREDTEEDPPNASLLEKLSNAVAAIHLAGVHRVKKSIPYLRSLEGIDYPRSSTGTIAMGSGWWIQSQCFRPILHHTLRLLGEQPQGFASYHFTQKDVRLPIPERIESRRARVSTLDPSMNAQQVLQLLGSPDHVRRESHQVGQSYRWTEDWEYDYLIDGQWLSSRITWEDGKRIGKMTNIEQFPSRWLHSNQREMDILDF
jgi:hypothetical protein